MQSVELLPTAGRPVVVGEWLGAGPDAPTLLAYGHYDVVAGTKIIDRWDRMNGWSV
jgi:acetylornithine deacetylase/succinyl-diaminopimelate desuccinylase-like protein